MLDFFLWILLFYILTIWIESKPFIWRGKRIQWKIPLPILGNTSGLLVKPWHQFWNEFYFSSNDEKIIGFHMFSYPALLIKDPNLIKKIMVADADHFQSRELHQDEIDPVGRSLFFTDKSEWRSQRVKMTPYFTPARIKAMLPHFHSVADRFTQYMTEEGVKGPVDACSASLKLSTDVIMSNIFGLTPDSFDNKDSFFFNLQKEMLSFDVGFRAVVGILAPTFYKLLGLTFFRKSTISKISDFVNKVILQRSGGVGIRPDFMQGMMELLDENDQKIKSTTNGKISDGRFDRKTVIGQCMLMYIAGTETTGNTLSFIIFELAKNQQIQDKLRDEINTMLKNKSDNYGVEDLLQLTYMNNVISESLRKYPIATSIGRKCTKEYTQDGLTIPVGTIIPIPIVSIHHDPNYFPDPDKFDPERFSTYSNIIPGTYLPFGLGPRTCIGMKFAQIEIMVSLCKLLSKNRILANDKTPSKVSFTRNPTLSSNKPLWVTVQPI